jgi:cell division protein FtsI (penicillin-binding protein 3)
VSAFAAIANGGRLMQPQIVRAVLEGDGHTVVRAVEPRVVRQVISPETVQVLTQMMTAVVREGTGHNAAIPGYAVAGKTGTAQKMDPAIRRYSRAPGVLSFIGFAPADDPRLVMLAMLDEPKNEKWGSEAAAPIFAAIGREALRYMNVPPRDTTPVPIVRGEIASADLPAETTPALPWPAGAVQLASFDQVEDGAVMPRVEGLSLRQAMEALAPFGVEVEISGRGMVRGQSPPAGASLARGTVCHLTLASPAARTSVSP